MNTPKSSAIRISAEDNISWPQTMCLFDPLLPFSLLKKATAAAHYLREESVRETSWVHEREFDHTLG